MRSILDKAFRYTPAAATDVRKTFRKERERLAKEKAERDHKVTTLLRKKA